MSTDSPQGLNLSRRVAGFVTSLYEIFKQQFFTYLEINPLVVTDSAIFVLDLAAKVMTNTLFIFLTQSKLIEPVWPQAAQLGIHFFLSQHTVNQAPPGGT